PPGLPEPPEPPGQPAAPAHPVRPERPATPAAPEQAAPTGPTGPTARPPKHHRDVGGARRCLAPPRCSCHSPKCRAAQHRTVRTGPVPRSSSRRLHLPGPGRSQHRLTATTRHPAVWWPSLQRNIFHLMGATANRNLDAFDAVDTDGNRAPVQTLPRPGARSVQCQPVIDLRSDGGGFGQEEEDRKVVNEPVSEVEREVGQALSDR
ncbi:MAG: hypothetical protein QOJ80_1435, partial [Mycobacterium sp.]|nr:hypothetical protein [Mycobacterium sp.]